MIQERVKGTVSLQEAEQKSGLPRDRIAALCRRGELQATYRGRWFLTPYGLERLLDLNNELAGVLPATSGVFTPMAGRRS